MRRTSTLHAAAAALGLLAGFAMTPAERSTLEGEVTPHVVSLAWDALPAPTGDDPAGVQADDWGGRLKPAEPPVRLKPVRARAPEGRRAAPAPRQERRAQRPVVMRKMEVATFQAPRRECPRAAEHAAKAAAHAESHDAHAAVRAAHAEAAARAEMRAAHAAHAAREAATAES